jgi:hypothetical protein
MLGSTSLTQTIACVDPRRLAARLKRQSTMLAGSVIALGLTSPLAHAATWYVGDYTVTLQSTLDYTLGVRTSPIEDSYYAGAGSTGFNADDGDRNFKSGIMENLFQTTEQLNIQKGVYGFRASAQALIDTVYLQHNKNTSPTTFNSYDIGPKGFPSATVAEDGRNFRMLAAFVYGAESFDNGQQRLSWQIGRQTITWGESLFSTDGLSGLQAPVNIYYAASEPNPQLQALFLPTGAASFSYDVGNGLTADAYWQFEYEPSIYPGVGSYFSFADLLGPGAQRILGSPTNATPLGPISIYRAPDIRPKNGLDQFGAAVHDTIGSYIVGLYFVRGIPKNEYTYTNESPELFRPTSTGLQVAQYSIVYAQPVNAVAVSASTTIGSANVAGELSDRVNQPLVSTVTYVAPTTANYNHPLYAVGNVLNLELNTIDLTEPLPLMPNGATVTGEFTFNDVLDVTARKAALTPGNQPASAGFELTFTPSWFPTPDIEVELPLGWTTQVAGDSQYDIGEWAGASVYDIGLAGVYKNNLTFGVNYQRYSGPKDREAYVDRDFATFYVDKTF